MAKFNVGDYVEVVSGTVSGIYMYRAQGVVMGRYNSSYAVEFDESRRGMGSCAGRTAPRHGLWVEGRCLKLVSCGEIPEFSLCFNELLHETS